MNALRPCRSATTLCSTVLLALASALQKPELARDRFAVASHTDTSGSANRRVEVRKAPQ